VNSGVSRGRTAPGDTLQGVTSDYNFFVAEFSFCKFSHKKINFSRVSPLEGVTRGGKEMTQVIALQWR